MKWTDSEGKEMCHPQVRCDCGSESWTHPARLGVGGWITWECVYCGRDIITNYSGILEYVL